MLVLDASVALAWCFTDEATHASESLLDDVTDNGAHVPNLWPSEVANVLVQAERRRRLTLVRTTEFVAMLETLPIVVDRVATWIHVFDSVLALARGHGLTIYDAAYLELALRLGLPLATRDAGLGRAARDAGVVLVPA